MPEFQVGVIIMRDRAGVLLSRPAGSKDWALPRTVVLEKESVRNASVRLAKAVTGLEVNPQQSLFFCEQIEPTHEIALFCLVSIDTQGGSELKPVNGDIVCRWADVRELAKIQTEEGMEDFSAQAFLKFSEYLKAHAAAATSGRVN